MLRQQRDCAALFGSNPTVADFYPVSKGHCAFGRGEQASRRSTLQKTRRSLIQREPAFVDIRIWGRYPRAYISLSYGVQMVDYTAATVSPGSKLCLHGPHD